MIPTPSKIQFGNEKIPLKLVFGAREDDAEGMLFGIGVNTLTKTVRNTKNKLFVRMDYHTWNQTHGGTDDIKTEEINVYKDDPFHYHVMKWERYRCQVLM